ncbi:2-oxoglutarate dehydrogenase E1 component [compost metagenome]
MDLKISADPTVMYGGNASFVEGLYEDFLNDPLSVTPEWREYFEGIRGSARGPETAHSTVQRAFAELAQNGRRYIVAAEAPPYPRAGVTALINAYRSMGHLKAKFNPLGRPESRVAELDPQYYGLTEADLASQVTEGDLKGSFKQVLDTLEQTYCQTIGFEYTYLPRVEREWLQHRIESVKGRASFDPATKRQILHKLNAAEGLERYLHKRYVGQKRFSLEGGDTVIPMLDQLIRRAGKQGVKEIVFGMAHRGRLNVLINIMGKKPSDLFNEFEGKNVLPGDISGDVKYHLGFSSDMPTEGGPVHLALAFNPSHLEIIAPVVEGSVRARQDRHHDEARDLVLPVVIHGDAAVGGQGVVAETLNLSQLRGFATGGTLHLVINNQVGFSISNPQDARSSRYCTDIAKFVDAPVFHVNGDDPEAAVFAMQLAQDYRMEFHKDVFIDLVCFRRHGHNESDEPRATQPMMYRLIDMHPGTRGLYVETLEREGVVTADEAQKLVDSYRDALDAGERVAEPVETDVTSKHASGWAKYVRSNTDWRAPVNTGVPIERLKELGERLVDLPEGFEPHKRIGAIFKARRDMLAGSLPLDWGMAENLAYATLVTQGYGVRLVGQDSGRGTFFHRHAQIHNQNPEGAERSYIPLRHLAADQARFDVYDSTLSELAVLGYEYGYSLAEPNTLDIWEAQYGDFANMAQPIIDQFISSTEAKWQRLSGLVMMLPHGYEGQGPEHSSARLERYLSLCAQQNMQVCVPSTPAQMYHMLRRQMIRDFRKPLIIMSPKSLLRHKASTSTFEELANGSFQLVIPETRPAAGITQVVLTSGKLYFELVDARENAGLSNVAIIRVEQLYPFPEDEIRAELAKYPNAQVIWAQEEPQNNGAWLWIRDSLQACLAEGQKLDYSSRPRSSSPAVGYAAKHAKQQEDVINKALGLA